MDKYSASIPPGATINAFGDVIFCATAEFRAWKKEGKELPFGKKNQ